MNKDINIVLTGADGAATAFDVVDGLSTITKASSGSTYSFPWRKVNGAAGIVGAAAVTSDYEFLPTAVSAGSVHSFYITQSTGDNESRTLQVSYTANASDDVDTVKAQLIVIINALESTGLIDVALTDLGVGLALQIEGTATNPVAAVSGAQGGTITLNNAGSEAVNAGTDLAALGVTDSFDGEVPSAALYNLYDLHLMLPKGHGGINGQTSDQEVDLKLYVEAGSAVEARIANALAGLNPITGVGSDELLGQNA